MKEEKQKSNFTRVTISLASSERILNRSHGEVTKPETINYRTYKPEREGLFCERIFGPTKDWECHCGKYKRIRYKGIICDRCGVEVTEKKVRRERMGHISLVVPVAHIWYVRSLPSKIGYLLGLSTKKLEMVVYYEKYIVIQAGVMGENSAGVRESVKKGADGATGEANVAHTQTDISTVKEMDFLTEDEYLKITESLPKDNAHLDDNDPKKFIAKMGGEALFELLKRIDLDKLAWELRHKANTETAQQRKNEALKRLQVVEAFRRANRTAKSEDLRGKGSEQGVLGSNPVGHSSLENRPEWMVMKVIPVIPPELRPLVLLDGGRFATSDLNDLYRRVIIRNNRLKRLIEIKAPEIILRNEKRMLQESVDALLDNSRKSTATKTESNRALKSLADSLKGKQGRFRQNLLGKRVDYSARSVIVVGPEMKLHECGLPKDIALELYKPFVVCKIIERGIVKTVKSARKLVDKKVAAVWDILENVIKGHPVLLNRAPTLHRLSIQAFQPKLIEGKAIQLHPLTCTAFNADFDGDQMAVHLPLGNAAILEAQLLMLASHNVLNPANGAPITVPSQDMVLGLYYMTKGKKEIESEKLKVKGSGLTFYSPEEAIIAFNEKKIDLHAIVKLKVSNKLIETTMGRILFNQVVPKEMGYINELLTKKNLRDIISEVLKVAGMAKTSKFLDDIKDLGYYFAFKGGLSFRLDDVVIPQDKERMIQEAHNQIDEVRENYSQGFITNNERYNQVIDIWTHTNSKITKQVMDQLSSHRQGFNAIYMMLDSGARGSKEQIRQLSGMRGLMAKPQKSGATMQEIVENPVISNFKEGLSILEYFISTHGARKGLADTALKTADAGYLTRRLVDVSQDVIITGTDCGTLRGLMATTLRKNDEIVETLYDKILGRVSLHDIHHPITGELIIGAGEEITEHHAEKIKNSPIESVEIRSVLTCEMRTGVCTKCYGRNLATGRMVQGGETVGVIAAQSIGEPGTQLTLRTFHVGGTAANIMASSKIEAKYDGIVEIEEIRTVTRKEPDGDKQIVISRSAELKILDKNTRLVLTTTNVPYGSILYTKNGASVKAGSLLCEWDPYNAVIISEFSGKIAFEYIEEGITFREETDEQTGFKEKVIIETKDKTKNPIIKIVGKKGDVLKSYNIPVGSHVVIAEGNNIEAGQILVKLPRIAGKSGDITGGLPRVTELFEARNPSNPAVVSEIDGVVSFGKVKRGNREVIVESKSGAKKVYMVPLSKHILAQENDFVKTGEPLSDGAITLSDILSIKGPTAVQEYLVNEIQEVYRLQGVKINDKHFEVIVRQMMRKVEIEDPGDSTFLEKQLVTKMEFMLSNDELYGKKVIIDAGDSANFKIHQIESGRKLRDENIRLKRENRKLVQFRDAIPATSNPVLQGITRASLQTESFISAASFQETVRVLNEAAISGKVDYLQGLKENVIVGHLIPAGTGLRQYEKLIVGSLEEYQKLMESKAEKELVEAE